jgi:GT2 family glycosyltransferase
LRKRDFESIGGFDEDFLAGEDIDFSWRAHLASLSLERAPDALIEIRAVTGARQSFRKGRFYGLAGPQLFRRYRVHGMARRRGLTLLRFYGGAVIRLAQIRNRDDLHAWLLLAGYRAGLIEGSLRQRVLYL